IPEGKVATYGQIAKLIGKEKNSRLVGRALRFSSLYEDGYPCYRVVNSSGRLVVGWYEQRQLLLEEGVSFKDNGNVDLKKCQWEV
ncbi:MAG: MGMT family protein, partial [Defluviitaleaceae bacterium]|nr:MGMT family protein [Defluviitaleaceae bacterium]